MKKIHPNVKCDCGHTQKDHYAGEGWCHHSKHKNPGKCGCTWFYPNMKYIKNKNEERKRLRKEKVSKRG